MLLVVGLTVPPVWGVEPKKLMVVLLYIKKAPTLLRDGA